MADQNIMIASDIVIAFVGHNTIAAHELPGLLRSVHEAVTALDAPAPQPKTLPEPAVSIRASIKQDHVTCLDCGYTGKMLKRHIRVKHGMDESQYRQRWNLPESHVLVAPQYAAKRRELAKAIGLGRSNWSTSTTLIKGR